MKNSEKEIKKIMGDKYHICDECSIYNSAKYRDTCRKSKPATKWDLEELYENLFKLIKNCSMIYRI